MILSIKSMSIIERQINALHARIVETLRRPDLLSTPSSLRGEMAELHTAAFRDLAHNDTLPFFRPHFLEIPGGLVTLSRHLDDLVAFLASLKAEERYKLANLSDVFIALGGIVELFLCAWAYLGTDMRKAGETLQGSLARIARFEDVARDQNLGEAVFLAPLTDALYAMDMSLKKLVVLLRP